MGRMTAEKQARQERNPNSKLWRKRADDVCREVWGVEAGGYGMKLRLIDTVVRCCAFCPYRDYPVYYEDRGVCNHPDIHGPGIRGVFPTGEEYSEAGEFPDWCPLKEGTCQPE